MEDCIAGKSTVRNVDPHGSLTFEKMDHGLYLRSAFDTLGRRTELLLPDNSSIAYRYDALYLREVERNGKTHPVPQLRPLRQPPHARTHGWKPHPHHLRARRQAHGPHLAPSHLKRRCAHSPRPCHRIASRIGPEKRNIRYTDDDLEQILQEIGPETHDYAYAFSIQTPQKTHPPLKSTPSNQITLQRRSLHLRP